jgi:hypothetical protein
LVVRDSNLYLSGRTSVPGGRIGDPLREVPYVIGKKNSHWMLSGSRNAKPDP